VVRVAESGIRGREDIDRLAAAGYDAFLIGETLMRENDPGAALALLLGREAAVAV
jgi:indole-3-glycerol phosphate synthase